eukprot:CAMPEP_0202475280 /NCGR_PEP_ID=MMETSP1360-20130828/92815_1 /ASSEMBLY_ACC=CAM_ASM_000848 /TAXON_ID=515479 /ORGANISM="Licmophora paradoxa, Strain CCMP2313" /LENGTH=473 /DNA_ID=CAMNT_0049102429 /DNA_START=26 /DNA_END=1447 /DNA_ORIENTATION=+
MTSFQRQLNLYDFNRFSRGPDRNGYYHEYFLRARPHLLKHITRVRVNSGGPKANDDPSREPNFYKMSFVSSNLCSPQINGNSAGITTSTDKSGTIATIPTAALIKECIFYEENKLTVEPQSGASNTGNHIIPSAAAVLSLEGKDVDEPNFSTLLLKRDHNEGRAMQSFSDSEMMGICNRRTGVIGSSKTTTMMTSKPSSPSSPLLATFVSIEEPEKEKLPVSSQLSTPVLTTTLSKEEEEEDKKKKRMLKDVGQDSKQVCMTEDSILHSLFLSGGSNNGKYENCIANHDLMMVMDENQDDDIYLKETIDNMLIEPLPDNTTHAAKADDTDQCQYKNEKTPSSLFTNNPVYPIFQLPLKDNKNNFLQPRNNCRRCRCGTFNTNSIELLLQVQEQKRKETSQVQLNGDANASGVENTPGKMKPDTKRQSSPLTSSSVSSAVVSPIFPSNDPATGPACIIRPLLLTEPSMSSPSGL